MTKKLGAWLGIIVAFLTISGIIYTYDKTKADVKDVDLLSMRLDKKIIQDEIKFLQQQILSIKMGAKKLSMDEERRILEYQNRIDLLMVELQKGV